MTDLEQILPLWQELREAGTEYVLATVVAVEGSGYRKPGARMLIGADGRRTGTISGGCLEAEVARKAFWHTEHGPAMRRYSTSAEDGEIPFGMGCGGIVHLLLERSATAGQLLERLAAAFAERRPLAIATVLEGDWIGERGYWPDDSGRVPQPAIVRELNELAFRSYEESRSFSQAMHADDGQVASVCVEWRAARPGLFVFGAGDDAVPLVKVARQLGWYVAVADGRSNLATRARFPEAGDVHVIGRDDFPSLQLQPTDAAAVLTHSMEQDSRILRELLPADLAYLGVLGPRRRTGELLLNIANTLGLPITKVEPQVEQWMEGLHAPMGLDLGGETPADIALAIVAEIQQCLHRASGRHLRELRAGDPGQRAAAGLLS